VAPYRSDWAFAAFEPAAMLAVVAVAVVKTQIRAIDFSYCDLAI